MFQKWLSFKILTASFLSQHPVLTDQGPWRKSTQHFQLPDLRKPKFTIHDAYLHSDPGYLIVGIFPTRQHSLCDSLLITVISINKEVALLSWCKRLGFSNSVFCADQQGAVKALLIDHVKPSLARYTFLQTVSHFNPAPYMSEMRNTLSFFLVSDVLGESYRTFTKWMI